MSKRSRGQEREHRPSKRLKHATAPKPPPVEEIQFARQIKHLLAFQQDGIPQLRHGIASFKAFLDSILYHKHDDDRARQLSILREYLDSEKPVDVKDSESPAFDQLWQAWSFANQNNNDYLASSIAAIFALLLKVLSSLLDFREHGILLCRTVLQHRHLRLIKWCLNAPKQKDFLISPCLRLLIEVTSFDGGVLARDVYGHREETFDVGLLKRNLGLLKPDLSEEEQQKKPSIRTWTVRYILAHLKYLHEGGKIDLLKSRPTCIALFQYLKLDPSDLVVEILSGVEQHVLKDDELPRSAKSSMLVQQNLERVVEVATRAQEDNPVAIRAFNWLKSVCSIPSYGILKKSGWYPPGTASADRTKRRDDIIDLGLDSIESYDHSSRPDVRNTTLLAWLQTLRPHSSLQERELVLTCFTSAPELVAAYLAEKNMQLDPKLSNTWIGYASFVFEIVALPVPEFLDSEHELAQLPPRTNVMIESILPRPLTQKVLTRCLNQSSDLITFFAVRVLVLAFEKFGKIRGELDKAAKELETTAELWTAASERLLGRFLEQCPKMKDVVVAFRKTAEDDEHLLQREALTRLLRLYYELTPSLAMEEQFDISSSLCNALVAQQAVQSANDVNETKALELGNLLQIASRTAGMRWFGKQGALEVSPILTLLRIHRKDPQNRQMRGLICHVLSENSVITSQGACDALVANMLAFDQHYGVDSDDAGFMLLAPYLDDWISRITRKPVKYVDDLDAIAAQVSGQDQQHGSAGVPSLFVAVLLEQAPFVSAIEDETLKSRLMAWVNGYMELLSSTNENGLVIEIIRASIAEIEGWESDNLPAVSDALTSMYMSNAAFKEAGEQNGMPKNASSKITFTPPPSEPNDHPELFRWANKDLEIAIEDGDVDSLILCLCSQYPEVRIQAHAQLLKLAQQVRDSSLEDKEPVYVLLGELIETYEHSYLFKSEALPYLSGTFAIRSLHVLMQPTHYMYPKVNAYLNKGPLWRVQRLPRYWLDNTVRAQPSEDDAYWKEIQWILTWLVDGLRTPADMEILRRAEVFEEVMCLYGSSAANKLVMEKVLEILWRATFISEGSSTLVTRTGVLAWLDMMSRDMAGMEAEVKERILETCDQERIEKWAGVKLEEL